MNVEKANAEIKEKLAEIDAEFDPKVEEILQIGTYQADFFVDGNRIGSYSFRIEKK